MKEYIISTSFAFSLIALIQILPNIATVGMAESTKYQGRDGDIINFPMGDASFADKVLMYDKGTSNPNNKNALEALGPPDFSGDYSKTFVSLGCGGSIILEFTDNVIRDVPGIDLYVFEVGESVEATNLEISSDGSNWINVGRIEGNQAYVDIASYVEGNDGVFRLVRLTDLKSDCRYPNATPGADIDAVGSVGALSFKVEPIEASAAPTNAEPVKNDTSPDDFSGIWAPVIGGGLFDESRIGIVRFNSQRSRLSMDAASGSLEVLQATVIDGKLAPAEFREFASGEACSSWSGVEGTAGSDQIVVRLPGATPPACTPEGSTITFKPYPVAERIYFAHPDTGEELQRDPREGGARIAVEFRAPAPILPVVRLSWGDESRELALKEKAPTGAVYLTEPFAYEAPVRHEASVATGTRFERNAGILANTVDVKTDFSFKFDEPLRPREDLLDSSRAGGLPFTVSKKDVRELVISPERIQALQRDKVGYRSYGFESDIGPKVKVGDKVFVRHEFTVSFGATQDSPIDAAYAWSKDAIRQWLKQNGCPICVVRSSPENFPPPPVPSAEEIVTDRWEPPGVMYVCLWPSWLDNKLSSEDDWESYGNNYCVLGVLHSERQSGYETRRAYRANFEMLAENPSSGPVDLSVRVVVAGENPGMVTDNRTLIRGIGGTVTTEVVGE